MIKWKDIPGYEGIYEVSYMGEVRALQRFVKRSNGDLRLKKMKTLKLSNHNCGYKTVNLRKNGVTKTKYVHRLVLSAYTYEKKGMDVNHKNGNKADNRIENLEWVTRKQNISHSILNGFTKPQKTGKDSKRAKLCTDGKNIYSLSEASKLSGYCNSYFCEMLRGIYTNKTNFNLIK